MPTEATLTFVLNFERKVHLQYRPGVASDLDHI